MKYTGHVYARMSEHELRVLRSKKYNRLTKLRREAATYLNMQERKRLEQQVVWIDAELECRASQMSLL
jgi:hypothetical protein